MSTTKVTTKSLPWTTRKATTIGSSLCQPMKAICKGWKGMRLSVMKAETVEQCFQLCAAKEGCARFMRKVGTKACVMLNRKPCLPRKSSKITVHEMECFPMGKAELEQPPPPPATTRKTTKTTTTTTKTNSTPITTTTTAATKQTSRKTTQTTTTKPTTTTTRTITSTRRQSAVSNVESCPIQKIDGMPRYME